MKYKYITSNDCMRWKKNCKARISKSGLKAVPSVSDEAAKFLPIVKCNRADSWSRNESGIPGEWIAWRRRKNPLWYRKKHHTFCFMRDVACVRVTSLPFSLCKKKKQKKFKIADQRKDIFDSRYSRRRRG